MQEADWLRRFGFESGVITSIIGKQGVLRTADGRELSFLVEQCVEPRLEPRQFEIILKHFPQRGEVGTKVLFNVRRHLVYQWCFQSAFNSANKAYRRLPLYRVTRVTTHAGPFVADPKTRSWVQSVNSQETVLCTDRNPCNLSLAIQRSTRPAALSIDFVYEVLQDGVWVKCENPLAQSVLKTA